MQVTRIENSGKQKVKIYLDGTFAFWLYRNDWLEYRLTEGMELDRESYREIVDTLVLRQAKQKALRILERMDRTEQELNQKLLEAEFSEEAAAAAVAYVKEFHYIDDSRYAAAYVQAHARGQSRRSLVDKLRRKGIDRETAEQAYETAQAQQRPEEADGASLDLELEALRKELNRRSKGRTDFTAEEQRKLAAALYRKGFSYDSIRRELSAIGEERYS